MNKMKERNRLSLVLWFFAVGFGFMLNKETAELTIHQKSSFFASYFFRKLSLALISRPQAMF